MMQRRRAGVALLLSLASGLVLLMASNARAQMPQAHPIAAGELLVGFAPDAARGNAVPKAALTVGTILSTNPRLGVQRVKIRPGLTMAQAAAQLARMPGVRYVEPNYILSTCATPNDTYFASDQYGPKKIMADRAWELWNPVAPIVIAIVDTGVDNTHPDLTQKILRDANGIVGYSALLHSASDALDDHGHGTHCAGIAAGQVNNGIGIAGVAGWNGGSSSDSGYTKIMPVKVLSRWGMGSTDQVAEGITWAADNGANIISLSLGGGGSTTLANAVSYAWNQGCVVVVAAGNSSTSTPSYPAAYPESIAVAATDNTDTLCSFSNYGSWVQVAAPGGSIFSTAPTYSGGAGYPLNYHTLSGTSMACPHVAGEAALIWANNPMLNNLDIKSLIIDNTDPYQPYNGRTIAGGRINAFKAMGGVVEPEAPAAPTNLTATGGSRSVSLSWTQSSSADVTQNRIYRSTSANSGYALIATVSARTSYSNTGLPKRKTYYYRVTAVNGDGLESDPSNTASAKTR